MRLHKILLRNIRSYVSQEIIFPEGKVLLWGDVGSGKSSVLYAIDFALFGIQRSELEGASLLRNDTPYGSVELFFSLGEKEYCIKRTLKRGKSGVAQESGFIVRGGIKEEKTAQELKQIVLDLLHYPKDLLTKNKTLIYRYTVYTPQEEMKAILLGSTEERLDTLRKVFGIDKYKRIKDNTKIIVTELKERKKLYEGASADLSEKVFEKDKKEKEKVEMLQKISPIHAQIESLEKESAQKNEELIAFEEKKTLLVHLQKDLALFSLHIRTKEEEKDRALQKGQLLSQDIKALEKDVPLPSEDIADSLALTKQTVQLKEKDLRDILNSIQEFKTKRAHSLHIQQKIESLNTCPTCFQDVPLDYKHTVLARSQGDILCFDAATENLTLQKTTLEMALTTLQGDFEMLQKKKMESSLLRLKLQHLTQKKEESQHLEERIFDLTREIELLHTQILERQEQEQAFRDIEAFYTTAKEKLETVQKKLQTLTLEKLQLEVTIRHLDTLLQTLQKDIEKKRAFKEKKDYLSNVQFWLTDSFVPLIETIEKNILFTVHAEFSQFFEKWFSLLIESNSLQIRLDEEYTPQILQNGFPLDYTFLSGGEKTACALAYRLALNHVINTLTVDLKTQDLLILDEPTDGFSSEQLERLKTVMDGLKIPQLILVSHESQVECFADHILRFEKRNHITRVVY